MKLLKEYIEKNGKAIGTNILKVDKMCIRDRSTSSLKIPKNSLYLFTRFSGCHLSLIHI